MRREVYILGWSIAAAYLSIWGRPDVLRFAVGVGAIWGFLLVLSRYVVDLYWHRRAERNAHPCKGCQGLPHDVGTHYYPEGRDRDLQG